jgi:hypothetical protein
LTGAFRKIRRQCFNVPCTIPRIAKRVNDKTHILQTDRFIELPAESDDFDIKLWIFYAKNFEPHLIELSVPTLLWLFVTKVWTRIPHLPWSGWAVLNKCTAHAGRLFGSQRNTTTTLVFKVVHLFGDYVCGVT